MFNYILSCLHPATTRSSLPGASFQLKPMMYIEYFPYFHKVYKVHSYFRSIYVCFA